MALQLHTPRCLLLPIAPADQRFIFEGLSHPQVIPYYGVRYATFEATQVQMDYYKALESSGTGQWWKITDRLTRTNIGAIGYNHYEAVHQKAEVGYWLLPAYWGRGFMAEALSCITRYLFTEKGLHRIEALVEAGNSASAKTAERAGFLLEGTLRDYEKKDGRFITLLLYSKLSTDDKNL